MAWLRVPPDAAAPAYESAERALKREQSLADRDNGKWDLASRISTCAAARARGVPDAVLRGAYGAEVFAAAGGPAPPLAPGAGLEEVILSHLRRRRGILNGRELFRIYRECDQPALRLAIESLEAQHRLCVKGDLAAPLGVFESVYVER